MFNVVYDPFLTRKTTISEKNSFVTPFFTLFVLSCASDNTTSQNIGGTDAWAVPHLTFWGDRPPSPPRSPPMSYSWEASPCPFVPFHRVAWDATNAITDVANLAKVFRAKCPRPKSIHYLNKCLKCKRIGPDSTDSNRTSIPKFPHGCILIICWLWLGSLVDPELQERGEYIYGVSRS